MHISRPKPRICARVSHTKVDNSSGVFECSARTTRLRALHFALKNSSRKLSGTPQCSNIVSTAFLTTSFSCFSHPFSSRVYLAVTRNSVPSSLIYFSPLTYALPISRTIILTLRSIRRSNQRICYFNNLAASLFTSIWHALTYPDALSIDVMKYLAPSTDRMFISATSVCNTAPGSDSSVV